MCCQLVILHRMRLFEAPSLARVFLTPTDPHPIFITLLNPVVNFLSVYRH